MKILVVAECMGPGFYTTGIVDGFKALGHKVKIVSNANVWELEGERLRIRLIQNDSKVLKATQEFQPDVMFLAKGDMITSNLLQRIKLSGVLTVVWQIDDPFWFEKVSLVHSVGYDMIYTTELNSLSLYTKHGMTAKWLPFGYDSNCLPKPNGMITQWRDRRNLGRMVYEPQDIAFCGNPLINWPESNRYEICQQVKKALPQLKLMGCELSRKGCEDWGDRVELPDMATIAERTKINLAFSDQPAGVAGLKMRHMEIPGYGGFMLSQEFSYLPELFRVGKEIEMFASAEECIEKAQYYLANERKRELMRRAGYRRAVRDHSYEKRAEQLLKDFSEKLGLADKIKALGFEAKREPRPKYWDADSIRHQLVLNDDMDAFRKSYLEKLAPELNSVTMWDYYMEEHRVFEQENPGTKARIQKTIDMLDGDVSDVIDVAAGYGLAVEELINRFPNAQLSATDFSPNSIKLLMEHYSGDFRMMRLDEMPKKWEKEHQWVLCLETLEHLDCSQTFDAWRVLKDLLRPDGIIVVSVPINESLMASSLRCPCCDSVINPNGHVRQYTPEVLRAEMQLAGFDVVADDLSVSNCYIVKAKARN